MKARKLIDDLIKSVEENNLMSWQFSRLVETLRRTCKKTLIKIWDNCYNDEKCRFVQRNLECDLLAWFFICHRWCNFLKNFYDYICNVGISYGINDCWTC